MKSKQKFLSLLLLVCFLITLFPIHALAYIDTDNIGTPAKLNEKGNWVGGDTFEMGDLMLIGYWNVVHKQTNEVLGKTPVLHLFDTQNSNMVKGSYSTIHPGTLEAWVKVFNGNYSFVEDKVRIYSLMRDTDSLILDRYWLREIAYACGAYVDPDASAKKVWVSTSFYPDVEIEEFTEPIFSGEPTDIGIWAKSSVLYRQEGGYPGLRWELWVDDDKIQEGSTEDMELDRFKYVSHIFDEPGEYTLMLVAVDGVGRMNRVAVKVLVEPGELEEEEEIEIPAGDPHLRLIAVSQDGKVKRDDYTAKWTDIVTADFTAPSAPSLGRCYRLKKWELQEAKITFPKKAKDFVFGHPVPPEGTITLDMDVDSDSNTATIDFQEDWSMNGAFLYDILEKTMIPGPTKYPIKVEYEMLWEYRKGRWDPCKSKDSEGNCKGGCVDWEDYSKNHKGSVTVDLLVNGTGVDSRAQ